MYDDIDKWTQTMSGIIKQVEGFIEKEIRENELKDLFESLRFDSIDKNPETPENPELSNDLSGSVAYEIKTLDANQKVVTYIFENTSNLAAKFIEYLSGKNEKLVSVMIVNEYLENHVS